MRTRASLGSLKFGDVALLPHNLGALYSPAFDGEVPYMILSVEQNKAEPTHLGIATRKMPDGDRAVTIRARRESDDRFVRFDAHWWQNVDVEGGSDQAAPREVSSWEFDLGDEVLVCDDREGDWFGTVTGRLYANGVDHVKVLCLTRDHNHRRYKAEYTVESTQVIAR